MQKKITCPNCGDKFDKPQAERMPGQVLRNLGFFPSERLTIRGVLLQGAANEFTGTVSAVLGTNAGLKQYQITLDAIKPRKLYDLPHIPLNAYLILKDVTVFYRGLAAAAHTFSLNVYYRDLTGIDHYLTSGRTTTAIGEVQAAVVANSPNIVLPGGLFNIAEPQNAGLIGLEGVAILGADTGTFDVALNIGIVYATPEER